jgi:hypothetical protein
MSGGRRDDTVTEALSGTGDILRGRQRLARLAYRLRIVHPGSGRKDASATSHWPSPP